MTYSEAPITLPEGYANFFPKRGRTTELWLEAPAIEFVSDREGWPTLELADGFETPRTPADLARLLLGGSGQWLACGNVVSVWKVFPPSVVATLVRYRKVKHEDYWWALIGNDGSFHVTYGANHASVSNVTTLAEGWPQNPPGIEAWRDRFFQVLIDHNIKDIGSMASAGNVGASMLFANLSPRSIKKLKWYRSDLVALATQADKGGRMESFQLGTFPKAYQYDLVSAYAAALRDVPALSDCQCVASNQYQPDAVMGFALCEVDEPDAIVGVSTFRHKLSDEPLEGYGLVWPFGTFQTTLALPTMKLLTNLGRPFKIIGEGLWLFPAHGPGMYAGAIDTIFAMTHDNPDLAKTFKIARNAGIGTLGSRPHDGVASAYQNMVYASHVKDVVRAMITEVALRHEDTVIRISIDGIALTSPLPASDPLLGNNPGQLKLEGVGPMLVLTDSHTDRPGKAAEYRQGLAMWPQGSDVFHIDFEAINGVRQFSRMDALEAWKMLGTNEAMTVSLPLGSFVRATVKSTASDYLSMAIPAIQLHVGELDGHDPDTMRPVTLDGV